MERNAGSALGKSESTPIADFASDATRQRQQRSKESLLRFFECQCGRDPDHGYAAEQAFADDRN
jgi:hypothetical protein